MIERAYHYSLGEPLKWIILALFQPGRFRATCEPASWRQRARMLARLIVPLFLLSYLLVILVRTVLLPAHLVGLPDETRLLRIGNFLVPVIGVAFGIALGMVFGTTWGVAFGIAVSLTAGVVFGLPGSYALLYTDVIGAWLVPVIGLALNVRGGLVARLEIILVVGLILGVIGGLTAGVAGGLTSGLAAGLASMLGLTRVPWYLGSAPSTVKAQERAVEDLDLRDSDRS
jgi:hypothetical protein